MAVVEGRGRSSVRSVRRGGVLEKGGRENSCFGSLSMSVMLEHVGRTRVWYEKRLDRCPCQQRTQLQSS